MDIKAVLQKFFRCIALTLFLSPVANAGTLALLEGRSAQPGEPGQTTIEVGYLTEVDDSIFGGRVSHQFSPLVTLYGDVSLIDQELTDGNAFGIGIRYHLAKQRLFPMLDASVRASYHRGSADFDGLASRLDTDLTELSFALHLGGKEAFLDNGMKWYGVFSLNRSDRQISTGAASSDNTNSDFGFGGGVYMPFGPGEAYVGVENINELFLGVGYRHYIGRSR